jgi:hypothetical protein
MKIQPKYTTFDQAKLLKEKEYHVPCYHFYELALTSQEDGEGGYSYPHGWKCGELNFQRGYFTNNYDATDFSSDNWFMCAAPEQWQVVEWLRLNHNIWISVDMVEKDSFFYSINKHDWEVKQIIFSDDFETPQAAYSAAFDYILNELI